MFKYITKRAELVRNHRENSDTEKQELLVNANLTAQNIGTELNIPKTVRRQQHCSNHLASNLSEF